MYRELSSFLVDSYQHVYEADVTSFTRQALELGGDVFPDYGRDIWEQSFREVRDIDTWPRNGTITEEQVNRAQSTLVGSGLLAEEDRLDPGRLIDERFMGK